MHWFENNKNLEGYLLSFKEHFWEDAPLNIQTAKTALFNNLLISSHFHLPDEAAVEVSALLENIQREYEKEDYANKAELLAAYVKILLIKLENIKQPAHPEHKPDYALFQNFVEQLELHFRTNHEAAWYAGQLFVSARKLSEVCNSFSGRSTKDLINMRIITEAKRTLQFTTSAVKELADMLGFADQYQFSKFFKKHTTLSPADYRARHAQIDI